jgi:DNA polymerase I
MNNYTIIENQDMLKDFLDFSADPEVSILEKLEQEMGILYKFNTGDEILVPASLLRSEQETHNDLIFGKDKTENIVSVTVDDNVIYLYKEKNGKIETEVRPHSFWLLAPKSYEGFRRLRGNGYYKYIHEVQTRSEFDSARQRGYKLDFFSIYTGEEGALVRQGITYFKGMKVEDVSVLAFDIETTGLNRDQTSRVLIISNSFRKNGNIIKKMFSIDEYDNNDADMIDAWTKWVRKMDPSVMCGHNIFSYDLPYINHCYSRTRFENIQLGRDGSGIKFNEYTSEFRKDGSQTYSYQNCFIKGREIVDTMFLSIKYDAAERNFTSYGLKSIITQLGLEKADRQHYDASLIAKNWNRLEERKKIKAYAMDDSDDALALYDRMIPPFFYYTQSIPKTLQQIINSATGAQINTFMMRAYLQNDESLPRASEAVPFEGAVSMGIPGSYNHVRKVDVASLYPSIMIEHKVYDKTKDPHGYFLQMVQYFTEQRLKNKQLAKETNNIYYKHLEQSQKLTINSAYGFLGTQGLLFNSPRNAAFITRKGREILFKAVEWATGKNLVRVLKDADKENGGMEWVMGDQLSKGKGYLITNCDTDSISYTDNKVITNEQFEKEIEELNSLFPKQIKWTNDGMFDKFIVLAAKNYIMKVGDKIKLKGSSLVDSKKETGLRSLLKEYIDSLLTYDINYPKLVDIFHKYIKEANNIQDINRWTVKKTVTKKVLTGERTNETKVMDALKGQTLQEGDKIWVYNALDGMTQAYAKGEPVTYKDGTPKMIENRILKLPEAWTKDEDKLHYVERVYKTTEILSNLLDMKKFTKFHLVKNRDLLTNL